MEEEEEEEEEEEDCEDKGLKREVLARLRCSGRMEIRIEGGGMFVGGGSPSSYPGSRSNCWDLDGGGVGCARVLESRASQAQLPCFVRLGLAL